METSLNVITLSIIGALAAGIGARQYETSGHSWPQALLAATAALAAALVVLMLIAFLIGMLHEAITFAKGRPNMRRRERIEARFPGARVTLLSGGKWLVTDIATGRTLCEIGHDGVTVISGDCGEQHNLGG
jgi:hypothetical protein